MNQYTLQSGDTLHLDYTIHINGISHSMRLNQIYVEKVDSHSCTIRVDSEMNSDVLISVRETINEGLVAYAEKKGGFLTAKEMRHYLDKQKFIEQLKDPK
jgi:hypothetical protein